MDFLQLAGRNILVIGVANRKSVAWHTAKVLQEAGANLIFAVRSNSRAESVRRLFPNYPVFVCDVEHQPQIDALRDAVAAQAPVLHGLVHSIAFADYSAGWLPFHQTPRNAFLQAVNISCYSLIALSESLRSLLDPQTGSVVTISISTTRMAAENYGYMAPVKAALDSSICFLAKSFSQFSRIRFNAVCPGLLKTSASAGIPGYVDSYLFAEKATLRKQAVQTEEVANAAAFLLSPRSSGINAQGLVIDAGMGINYFDQALVSPQSEPIPIPETPRVYSEAIRSENEVPPENSGMIHK
jgi:enoyl-[acyl-carrier protein] reductase I